MNLVLKISGKKTEFKIIEIADFATQNTAISLI
jgi:hypothetical protein